MALVLAESREALRRGIAAVHLQIQALPAVFDAEAALAEGAPLVHETHPRNILLEAEIRKGDALSAPAACEVVVRGELRQRFRRTPFSKQKTGSPSNRPMARYQ